MLKMIIADDEFIVRDGLKNIINWEEFGIEVIGDAEDGQEALDLCINLKPDILLTDIKMPLLDGLEVSLKLKELGSNIKIIIISGIQDFNYAKTALSFDAAGYILKPVKINELKDVVQKVVNSINLEKNSMNKFIELQKELSQNIPLIREKFLRNLISGIYISPKDVWDKINYCSLPFEMEDYITAAVLQIDDYEEAIKDYKEENKQLLTFCVCNITEEILANYGHISFSTSEYEYVILFSSKTLDEDLYIEICEELSKYIRKFLNISISIGIGSSVKNVLEINNSYNEALTALEFKFYTGQNSILPIKDFSQQEVNDHPDIFKIQDTLIKQIKVGDSESVKELINTLFKSISQNKNLPMEYVQSICIELISVISRNLYELGESLDAILEPKRKIFEAIYKTDTLFSLQSYLLNLLLKVSSYFMSKYSQKNTKIVDLTKKYILKNYMKNISIVDLAKEIYLTPNYLSLIFKQETGETIIEYLTKIRMEQAKKLLESTDLKVVDISQLVGYENPHYFSTAFKRYTKVTPQKYRSDFEA